MKLSRRLFLSGVCASALFIHRGAEAWIHGQGVQLVTWDRVVINGGGFMMGFSIADDGTKLCRTDIGGAYKWDGSKWVQLVDQTRLPYPNGGYRELAGVPAIEIAASDSSVIYALIQDRYANGQVNPGAAIIYKSVNGGTSFSNTNYPQNCAIDPSANEGYLYGASAVYKFISHKIAVDPINSNVVYACNPGGYPQVTQDGGLTWSAVPNLPTANTSSTLTTSITQGTGVNTGGTGGTPGTITATLVGGTSSVAATVSITVNASGVMTAVTAVSNAGSYSEIPSTPCALTGAGVPSGATVNVGFTVAQFGATCWTFDKSNGSTGGKTNNIYVAVQGDGTWVSNNAGASFTRISTTVGFYTPYDTAIASDGTAFYIVDSTSSSAKYGLRLNRYVPSSVANPGAGGAWTTDITANTGLWRMNVAAHPTTAGIVCAQEQGNHSARFWYSSTYGASGAGWTSFNKSSESFTSTDAPWWAAQITNYDLTGCGMTFNPATPDELWIGAGQGQCKATITALPGTAPQWTGSTAGIENAVCDGLTHESGTVLLQVMADITGFPRATNALSTPPNLTLNMGTGNVNGYGPFIKASGWAGAIDAFNTNNMAIATDGGFSGVQWPGYSTDGGVTWQKFPNFPGPVVVTNGTTVAGSNVLNFASVPSYVAARVAVYDTTSSVVPAGTTVVSKTSTTVTLSNNVTGGGVGNGDSIAFGLLAGVIPNNIFISNGRIFFMPLYQWYYTDDFGTTWTICPAPGVVGFPATPSVPQDAANYGWGGTYSSIPSITGCADRVNYNKIFLYNSYYMPLSGTVTFSGTSPGQVNFSGHRQFVGAPVVFTTTGALPSNITAGTIYYILAIVSSGAFTIAASPGGTAIDVTVGTPSGTNTCTTTPIKGLYKSTDKGATFTYTGVDPFNAASGQPLNSIKSVPGKEDWLMCAAGYISSAGAEHPVTNSKFFISQNAGASWTQIANFYEAYFGFGKAGSNGNPTLYANGFYRNVYGTFMSTDFGTTWLQLISADFGQWPGAPGVNNAVQCVEGDKDIFGRCYVGFSGDGTVYSTFV